MLKHPPPGAMQVQVFLRPLCLHGGIRHEPRVSRVTHPLYTSW